MNNKQKQMSKQIGKASKKMSTSTISLFTNMWKPPKYLDLLKGVTGLDEPN